MTAVLPAWVAAYIGLPWRDLGRDRSGVDCWGLVRLVLAEQYDVSVPLYDTVGWTRGCDAAALGRLITGERDRAWIEVDAGEAAAGDVVLLRMAGRPIHVGIVVAPGWMLHIEAATDAALARYRAAPWTHRVLGFYRPGDGL